ncbi:MAG TPA: class I SAM-dependent methyltransferase [Polyangiaceae bacterium]|nr:class I SAM-dependent methyltransferase [Polyangiaceae bacterium]
MLASLGAAVRGLFGAHEQAVAELYRSVFVDLDALVRQLASLEAPARILEVGCGEGQMTQRLAQAFPHAEIVAVDISPRVGRLVPAPGPRVHFRCCTLAQLLGEGPAPFQLVTLCDVLHHVPPGEREALLSAVRELCAPGGRFVFKDWERRQTPIHWACAFSDRLITGDRVQYCSRGELRDLLGRAFAGCAIEELAPTPPWLHNRAWCVRLPREPNG